MDKYSVPRPERESYVRHRRDLNRQIIIPMILMTLVGVAFAVLAAIGATGNDPDVSLWADISIIWLVIPMMLLALVILAVMIAMIYGLRQLLKISPHYTGIVQEYAMWLHAEVIIWTDKIIHPVLSIRTWLDLILKREG